MKGSIIKTKIVKIVRYQAKTNLARSEFTATLPPLIVSSTMIRARTGEREGARARGNGGTEEQASREIKTKEEQARKEKEGRGKGAKEEKEDERGGGPAVS